MSLTPKQTALHWRRWGKCADANHWFMIGARLSPDARLRADESIYQKLVWRSADQLALAGHRAVTADDLRHACYITATTAVPLASIPNGGEGRGEEVRYSMTKPVASLGDLDNRAFSRVMNLWRLLVEPDDLDAAMNWDHPENDERRRYIAVIKKCARGTAYVGSIAANIYGTRLWEDLDVMALRNLCRILGERQKAWSAEVAPAAAKELTGIEQPY